MRNLNWWIKFVSIVILVACRSSNHSLKQSIIIFVMHKKIDIKQDNIEKKKAFDVIFGGTQSFQNKIYDIFFKKKKRIMRLFFLFCFDFVIDFVLSECKNLKNKKKRNRIFFCGGKRKRNFVLRESGFLRKLYFSNM